MKKITSIFLCFLMLLSAISFQVFADEAEGAVQGDTAEGLTNEWYGGLNLVITENSVDEAVITEDVLAVLEKYLALRELSFNNPEGKANFDIFLNEAEAEKLFAERNADVDVYETNINSIIDFAEVTLKIEGAEVKDGVYTLAVHEWTFYDYFDKAGEMKVTDVSGYGVDHEMTLEYVNGNLVITGDEYLDDTLNFDEFAASSSAQAKADAENGNGLFAEDFEADTNGEFITGYDIGAAVAYSDAHWSSYNHNFYNFAPLGGDCANFVSQCLLAGGMPMHYGAAYSSTCWYYTTSSDRSGSWTGAKESWYYWSTYRGNGIVNPGNGDVWIGCPVYVDWASDGVIDHAYFCVGRNSAGTAIINSHTADKYHCHWNYGYSYSTYYTVQVTPSEGQSSSVKRPLEGNEPIDLGENFYAHIRQTATGLYLTDRDYNVFASEGVFDASQTWHFHRQSDGSYIIGADSSGMCWDIENANYSDGANILMWNDNGGANQKFFIYYIAGNFYFKAAKEDKVVDVDTSSKNLQIWGSETGIGNKDTDPTSYNARSFEIFKLNLDYGSWNINIGNSFECYIRNSASGLLLTENGWGAIFSDPIYSESQKWIVTRNEYGGHEIKSVKTGMALDVYGCAMHQGADVDMYEANGTKAQRFFFIGLGESLMYIKPSYTSAVLDMDANSKEIHLYYPSSSDVSYAAQVFELVTENHLDGSNNVRAPKYLGDSFEANVILKSNGVALTEEGEAVAMRDFTDSASQTWKFTYDKEWNAYKVVGASGKVLDVSGAGYRDGTELLVYESNDAPNQRFRFYSWDGGYIISPANSQRVVDVDGGTGPKVQIWGPNGTDSRVFSVVVKTLNGKKPVDFGESFTSKIQNVSSSLNVGYGADEYAVCTASGETWTFTRNANGSYEIKIASLNKALDIEGAKTENGTPALLWETSQTRWQSYFIYESNGGYVLMPSHCGSVLSMDAESKKIVLGEYKTANSNAQTFALPGVKVEATLSSIAVSSKPEKVTYTVGDTLDTTGLALKATYSDGSTKTVKNGFTVSPSGVLNTLGTVQITVTYEGKKTTFNVTVNEKAVQVENLIIKSDSSLKKDDKYVTKVSAEKTTADVLSNFENLDAVVFDAKGNQVTNTVVVGTGYSVNLVKNGVVIDSLVVVVSGDVDGDGMITTTDYLRIKAKFNGTYDLENEQFIAGDVCEDGIIDTTDYLRIKGVFVGSYSFE